MDSGSPPSFLSLPIHVRKRIYFFAGLTRECPIVMIPPSPAITRSTLNRDPAETRLDDGLVCNFASRNRGRGLGLHMPHESRECECPEVPKQLLLINKALHGEIRDILYGENQFVLRARRPDDLELLYKLSDDALRALSHLLIRLNSWPCYRGHSSDLLYKLRSTSQCLTCEAPVSKSDGQIFVDPEKSKSMETWSNFCQRLASCLAPGRLNLEFICDVGDLRTGEKFAESLQVLRQQLKSCAIRLGRRRDARLRSLARSTAANLTASQPESEESPFPFLLLPHEVRLRVLSYTNLGPHGPFKPEWSDITIKRGKFSQSYPKDDRSLVYRRACCLDCSFTKLDCTCPLNYSSVSPNCTCRDLPLDLLRVNQQMNTEAAQVLFATNMFSFEGPFTDTLKMLRSLDPASLKLFRRIRFRFEAGQIFKWRTYKQSWTDLISFIGQNFDTPRLFIVFDTNVDSQSCRERHHDQTIMNTVYDGYVFFMQEMKAHITVLLDFHVTLGVFHYLERIFEKHILGQEYDSHRGNQYSKPARIFEADPDDDDDDSEEEALIGVRF
ncbi:unnamed protein product [Clonostachys solani]|uniref:Uncharacterized protein n=1 Tax=Clonostachys solani TaxID=160281 RepID=A0A9P0EL00_9HYPO|nr:unnamed protein product [Clonostachys solani]